MDTSKSELRLPHQCLNREQLLFYGVRESPIKTPPGHVDALQCDCSHRPMGPRAKRGTPTVCTQMAQSRFPCRAPENIPQGCQTTTWNMDELIPEHLDVALFQLCSSLDIVSTRAQGKRPNTTFARISPRKMQLSIDSWTTRYYGCPLLLPAHRLREITFITYTAPAPGSRVLRLTSGELLPLSFRGHRAPSHAHHQRGLGNDKRNGGLSRT